MRRTLLITVGNIEIAEDQVNPDPDVWMDHMIEGLPRDETWDAAWADETVVVRRNDLRAVVSGGARDQAALDAARDRLRAAIRPPDRSRRMLDGQDS